MYPTKIAKWGIPEKGYQMLLKNVHQMKIVHSRLDLWQNSNLDIFLPCVLLKEARKKSDAISRGPPSIPKSVLAPHRATDRESNRVWWILCTLGNSVSLYCLSSISKLNSNGTFRLARPVPRMLTRHCSLLIAISNLQQKFANCPGGGLGGF